MKKAALFSLITFLVISFAFSASAGDVVEISVGEVYDPWLGEDHVEGGFIVHVITEAFKEAGYEVEVDFRPWERAYEEAIDGDYDATGHWFEADWRKEDNYYSNPINTERFVIFYTGENPIPEWEGGVEELSPLEDYTIGIVAGYTYPAELLEAAEEGKFDLEETTNDSAALQQLNADRTDIFIGPVAVAEELMGGELAHIADDISYTEEALVEYEGHLLFPRDQENSPKLLEDFNAGLEQLREDSRYDEFYEDLLTGKYQPDN